MPPSIAWIRVSARAAALDMQLSGGMDLGHGIEVGNHRELFAPPEQRAVAAVCGYLLRQPGVRNNGEAHVGEIRRLVREHTQVVVAGRACADSQLVDDAAAEALSATFLANHERPDFG